MNVNQGPERAIGPAEWKRSDLRPALAIRDIASVFRLLKHHGVSQRRIAALTGQSQSEVSEILKGRQVMAYDVLTRIADGLRIPRSYMGLAHDETSAEMASTTATVTSADEREEVRQLLARVAEVTVGAAVLDPSAWTVPFERTLAPIPERIGMTDVTRIEKVTHGLRLLDLEHGGGSCRDATVAQVHWAQQLLTARCTDDVGHHLHLALADLHNLAGWTSLDVGLYTAARRHFMRALEQARHAGEPSLVAKVLYCLGRLHLHCQLLTDALKFFQLGQIAAQESGCGLAVAIVPTWIQFFGQADLDALIAMAYAFLPITSPNHRGDAIAGFTRSLAACGSGATRSRAFELTALAMVHLQDGDLGHGVVVGHQAADLAEKVRSLRVVDRLAPLLVEAQRHRAHADVADLADRIATLCAA